MKKFLKRQLNIFTRDIQKDNDLDIIFVILVSFYDNVINFLGLENKIKKILSVAKT